MILFSATKGIVAPSKASASTHASFIMYSESHLSPAGCAVALGTLKKNARGRAISDVFLEGTTPTVDDSTPETITNRLCGGVPSRKDECLLCCLVHRAPPCVMSCC